MSGDGLMIPLGASTRARRAAHGCACTSTACALAEPHAGGPEAPCSSPLVPTTTPRCSSTNGDPEGSAEQVAQTPTETQDSYMELASREMRLMGATNTSNSEVPTVVV